MPLTFLSPLHRATRQIALWFEERSPDHASIEGHLLTYLVPYGPCPVSELTRVFGAKHSTMTSILDRLEERGLVAREENPNDRRSLLVALTKDGRKAAVRVNALVEELEQAIGERVSPRDLAGFQKVMRAIEEATGVVVRDKKQ
ncbi:MAG: MarR family transcriptional regulator [Acidobacteria bacterium]|nr:MarR family transcriptional regulator [Acidobacteriota bacterium]MBV9477068.1 MarR family transcriptional regulator [Acidobacteriota bacterium]